MRFISRLGETSQPWLVVLDDLPETTYLEGLWPEGSAGRLLVTSRRRALAVGRRGTQVIPVGLFSVREALKCLTEWFNTNPVQRLGAIDLVETLGREPLALAQASSVVASSTLDCLGYRDLFVRRRQQICAAAGEIPSAAMLTWTLSLALAESLLPGMSVRLMLALVALLDGHGIPGAIFSTSAVAAYLGGAATPRSAMTDPKPAWDTLLALERTGLISVDRNVTPPTVLMNSAVQAAIRRAAPAEVQEPAAHAAASALPAPRTNSGEYCPTCGEGWGRITRTRWPPGSALPGRWRRAGITPGRRKSSGICCPIWSGSWGRITRTRWRPLSGSPSGKDLYNSGAAAR
jgi:hypothetical protein